VKLLELADVVLDQLDGVGPHHKGQLHLGRGRQGGAGDEQSHKEQHKPFPCAHADTPPLALGTLPWPCDESARKEPVRRCCLPAPPAAPAGVGACGITSVGGKVQCVERERDIPRVQRRRKAGLQNRKIPRKEFQPLKPYVPTEQDIPRIIWLNFFVKVYNRQMRLIWRLYAYPINLAGAATP